MLASDSVLYKQKLEASFSYSYSVCSLFYYRPFVSPLVGSTKMEISLSSFDPRHSDPSHQHGEHQV